MYKDVAKKITAWILVLCMIGSVPDFSLWAAPTGNGGHSYQNYVDDGQGKQFVNTSYKHVTITNTFTADANQVAGMTAQKVESVSFKLNAGEHWGGTGEFICEADYAVKVTAGGKSVSKSGQYQMPDHHDLDGIQDTITVDGFDELIFGEGDTVTVEVTVGDAANGVKWIETGGIHFTGKDTVSFEVANAAQDAGESSYNGTSLTNSGKAACVKLTTSECASKDDTTAMSFKKKDLAVPIEGGVVELAKELQFTPSTAKQRDAAWESSDQGAASVDGAGRLTPKSVGTTTITATLKDKPAISDTITIKVCKNIDSSSVTVNNGGGIPAQEYTGEQLKPKADLYDGSTKLSSALHYSHSYGTNINAGTGAGTVTFTGNPTNGYTGDKVVNFDIEPASLKDNIYVKVAGVPEYTYPTEAEVTAYQTSSSNASATAADVLKSWIEEDLTDGTIKITYAKTKTNELAMGTDYTITGSNLTQAGAGAYVEITGQGNYKNTLKINIPIKKEITSTGMEIRPASGSTFTNYWYTGEVYKPEVEVWDTITNTQLTPGVHYDANIEYADSENGTAALTANAGTKYIRVKGLGSYATADANARLIEEYEVQKRSLQDNEVYIEIPKQPSDVLTDPNKANVIVRFPGKNGKNLVQYDGSTNEDTADYKVETDTRKHPSNDTMVLWFRLVGMDRNFTGATEWKVLDTGIDIKTVDFKFAASNIDTLTVDYKGPKGAQPGVVLTKDGTELVQGKDYEVEYENNTKVGTATVRITGIGNYAGIMTKPFTIQKVDLTNNPNITISLKNTNLLFNAKMVSGAIEKGAKPEVTVTYKGHVGDDNKSEAFTYTLVEKTDYTLSYTNETMADGNSAKTANSKVTITGAGDNFATTTAVDKEYNIDQRSIDENDWNKGDGNKIEVGTKDNISYPGRDLTAEDLGVYVKHNDVTYSSESNATEFGDYFNVTVADSGDGKVLVSVDAKENTDYMGHWEKEVNIAPFNISGGKVTIDAIADMEYQKDTEIHPEPVVKLTSGSLVPLVKDQDYTVSYKDCGETSYKDHHAKVVVTGKGKYSGTAEKEFIIYKNLDGNAGDATNDYAETIKLTSPIPPQYFTGEAIEVDKAVIKLGDYLKNNGGVRTIDLTDFTVGYPTDDDHKTIGDHKVTLTGDGKYYQGSIDLDYEIVKNSISNVTVTLENDKYTYGFTGSQIKPKPVVMCGTYPLVEGTDYTVTWGTNRNVGDVDSKKNWVRITAVSGGNFGGIGSSGGNMKTVYFDITAKELEQDATLYTYNYPQGDKKLEMLNGSYDFSSVSVVDIARGRTLDGPTADTPEYTLSVKRNTDDLESGWLIFTGVGNYTGSVRFPVKLEKQTLDESQVTVSYTPGSYVYTGRSVAEDTTFQSRLTVDRKTGAGNATERLKYGEDYIIAPVNASDDLVNYTGRETKFQIEFIGDDFQGFYNRDDLKFTIIQRPLSDSGIKVDIPSVQVGETPTVTVTYTNPYGDVLTLTQGTDYTYVINNGQPITTKGTYPVEITAVTGGNYSGKKTQNFGVGVGIGSDVEITLTTSGYAMKPLSIAGYEGKMAYVFQGEEIKPAVTGVKLSDGTTLSPNNYDVTYVGDTINASNLNADAKRTPSVKITGKNGYAGSAEQEYYIIEKNMADTSGGTANIPSKVEAQFTGSEVQPDMNITFRNTKGNIITLKKGVNYSYPSTNLKDVGVSQPLTVNFSQNYTYDDGKGNHNAIVACTVTPKDFIDEEEGGDIYVAFANPQDAYEYTDSSHPVEPELIVKDIKRGGTGDYNENGTVAQWNAAYSMVKGKDYDIKYQNNKKPGTATVTITGKGNYKNSQSISRTFRIKGTLNNANVELIDALNDYEYQYTGNVIKPRLKIWFGDDSSNALVQGREGDATADFWCEYPDEGERAYIDAGIGKRIIVHGSGNYKDSVDFEVTFDIIQRNINDAVLEGELGSFAYKGQGVQHNIMPKPSLSFNGKSLVYDEDFDCVWPTECWDVNTDSNPKYTITITGKGNFVGTYEKEVSYTVGNSFTKDTVYVEMTEDEFDYTGNTIKPVVTVKDKKTGNTLTEGVHYNVSINDSNPEYINAGKKTFRVYGIDSDEHPYRGDVELQFTIKPIDLNDRTIIVDEEGVLKQRYQYYGGRHVPVPSVKWRRASSLGGTLELTEENGDFTYDYQDNVNAGDAKIIIGPGRTQPLADGPNFVGTREVIFKIQPITVDADSRYLEIIDNHDPQWEYIYTGSKIVPDLTIKYDGVELTNGVDYVLDVQNGINVTDNAKVKITFKGNYQNGGDISKTFVIRKRSVTDEGKVQINMDDSYKYIGTQIRPEPVITYEGQTLVNGTDYKLTYGDNTNVTDNNKVVIEGINNYQGIAEIGFDITPIDITSGDVLIPPLETGTIRNGKPAEPEFMVYWMKNDQKIPLYEYTGGAVSDGNREYAYTYRYYDNTAVGMTGKLEVTGVNNFTGVKTLEFDIRADICDYIKGIEWKNGEPSLTFNNKSRTNEVRDAANVILTDDTDAANRREGYDYEFAYEPVENGDGDTKNAGKYKVFIRGIGNYGGRTNELPFTIQKRSIKNVAFTPESTSLEFSGSAQEPKITAEDKESGLILEKVELADAAKTSNANGYTAAIIKGDATNVGKHTVAYKAVDNGNYTTEEVTLDFEITARSLAKLVVEPDALPDCNYDGKEHKPELKVIDKSRNPLGGAVEDGNGNYELTADDCIIVYSDNIYPGEATVTITGKGNYQDNIVRHFTINADLSAAEIAPIPVQPYTGKPVTPALTVSFGNKKLVLGTDYTVTYDNNTERGDNATATIHAVTPGLYTGSKTVTFSIGRSLANAELRAIANSFTYTGSAITPQVVVDYGNERLVQGRDYTVQYSNNINVGTATITVTGTGAYEGSITRDFRIVARNITRCSFSNPLTRQYNGQATSQNVTVVDGNRALTLNRDYSIRYLNNTNPGTATIQITGLGNYSGIKTIKYNIEVKPMTATSITGTTSNSVSLAWTPVDSAQGYAIYNTANNRLVGKTTATSYTHGGLASGQTYGYRVRPYVVSDGATYYGDFSNSVSAVTNPGVPTIKVKAGKKQAKVSWNVLDGVTGYEVYRSTKKNKGFKKVKTIKKASTKSYTNKKLKSGKKYYFKVRAYRTANGVTVYGDFSATKKVKVK